MKRLKIELLSALERHEPHGRSLDGFGNRFRIAIVVLMTLEIGLHILSRHQPNLMPHGFELTTKVMGPCASFHADQASRNIGKRTFELMSRPLLPQYNRAETVESNDMKAVLAQVDADGGNGRL